MNSFKLKNFINKFASLGETRTTMAEIIDGKQIAAEFRAKLRLEIESWLSKGNRQPHLTAILIGSDPASCRYVKNKMAAAKEVGIRSETKKLPTDITEVELLEIIKDLNNDEEVDGILVQLPVPNHINERKITNAVSCEKDVDGFNERNVGRLCLDMNTLIPCTPLAVKRLLEYKKINTYGKKAVVVGRSKNVGMPIAMLLHTDGKNDTKGMDSTVTICHRYTPREDLITYCQLADIIISATGIPGLITSQMVKPGACIIDVGITEINDTVTGKSKLVGDVDFSAVKEIAGYITPVPGGVGPMTVAMLMQNTFIAAKNIVLKKEL